MTSPTFQGLCLSLVAVFVASGCATSGLPSVSSGDGTYDWFRTPDPLDAWSPKIAGWQSREAVDVPLELASVSVSGTPSKRRTERSRGQLAEKYVALRRGWKHKMAEEVAEWIQHQAPEHYRPDGPIDHWATLEETLERDGDDCDGLELLVFHFLRDLGFRDDEVFRAIVYRPSDGQHHMVTLWFESSQDPFVIDPTGAMTRGMPRMSEVPGWVPLKVFTETAEFTVAPHSSVRAAHSRAQTRPSR